MDARSCILLAILTQGKLICSMSISGEISEDITFLHILNKAFPVPPSMRAIIQVDVSFPESSGL